MRHLHGKNIWARNGRALTALERERLGLYLCLQSHFTAAEHGFPFSVAGNWDGFPPSSLPISTVYHAGNGARSCAPSDGSLHSLSDLRRQARGLHVIWDWVLGVSGGFDNLDGRHCHLSLPGNGHASGLSRILPLVLGPSFPPHLCMLLGKHWDWENLFLELVSFLLRSPASTPCDLAALGIKCPSCPFFELDTLGRVLGLGKDGMEVGIARQ